MSSKVAQKQNRMYTYLIIIGIVVVAFNLRPAITSIGPLIGMIRLDLGLEHWSAGLLTSLPLLAFAAMSPIVPQLGNRHTNERMMVLGLIIRSEERRVGKESRYQGGRGCCMKKIQRERRRRTAVTR